MIRFLCPSCRGHLSAPDEARGKTGKCPHCSAPVTFGEDLTILAPKRSGATRAIVREDLAPTVPMRAAVEHSSEPEAKAPPKRSARRRRPRIIVKRSSGTAIAVVGVVALGLVGLLLLGRGDSGIPNPLEAARDIASPMRRPVIGYLDALKKSDFVSAIRDHWDTEAEIAMAMPHVNEYRILAESDRPDAFHVNVAVNGVHSQFQLVKRRSGYRIQNIVIEGGWSAFGANLAIPRFVQQDGMWVPLLGGYESFRVGR